MLANTAYFLISSSDFVSISALFYGLFIILLDIFFFFL